MERILNNYDFLLELVQSKHSERKKILEDAKPEQILAVIDCVKLSKRHNIALGGADIIKRQRRWKRAVSVLKKNSKLLTPTLVAVLCTLLREALIYLYNME